MGGTHGFSSVWLGGFIRANSQCGAPCLRVTGDRQKPAFKLRAAEQIVAGERGIAPFSTGFVRRGLRATARAT
jgi:hypothetical protein